MKVALMIIALQRYRRHVALAAIIALAAIAGAAWPSKATETIQFVIDSFVDVAPMIGVGLILSAWAAASGVGAVTAKLFQGRPVTAILAGAAIGAVTPVCGVAVLPLMVGFLAGGVPLAPIMAFWLSSPVTDPGVLAATWAVLDPAFAIGKTAAAFAIGLIAGAGTAVLAATDMVRNPLRTRQVDDASCRTDNSSGLMVRIWQDTGRMWAFRTELIWMTRLVIICLSIAFAAEHLLRDLLPPDVLAAYVGEESPYAILLSVTLGAPLYLDGYAALPLVRGLLDLGMSPGAAMAFLVAGSAVSIWGVLAVVPVLRASTAILFVALAILGSLGCGYVFSAIWGLLP
jgi:uncharacterized protein